MKTMACKQNLPCPALLHQPFAILGFDLFGNGWKLQWHFYGQQEVGWVPAVWLHYRLQPSTCRGITQQPFSLLQAALPADVPGAGEDRHSYAQKDFHWLSSKERSGSKQPIYLGVMFQPAQAHSLFHFGQQIVKTTVSIPSSSSALSLTFTVQQEGVLIIHME